MVAINSCLCYLKRSNTVTFNAEYRLCYPAEKEVTALVKLMFTVAAVEYARYVNPESIKSHRLPVVVVGLQCTLCAGIKAAYSKTFFWLM